MLKKFASAGLLFLVVAALVGCVSAPEKTSLDDCLVIVKSDFVKNPLLTDEQQSGRYYQFELSGGYPKTTIRKDYTTLVVKEPAVGVTAMLSGVQPPNIGPVSRDKLDISLPYKPGYIVVADFVFVKKTESTSANMYMTRWSLRKITDAERADLLERFKNDSDFKDWKE
jgi:hypothetical protein